VNGFIPFPFRKDENRFFILSGSGRGCRVWQNARALCALRARTTADFSARVHSVKQPVDFTAIGARCPHEFNFIAAVLEGAAAGDGYSSSDNGGAILPVSPQ
jgi:hypothetical protein